MHYLLAMLQGSSPMVQIVVTGPHNSELAALLSINNMFDEKGSDAALQMSKKGNSYLLKILALSDQ
jgi:hypothetical protein